MVWACGKNGRLPYGQKGVDGCSQWGTPPCLCGHSGYEAMRPRLGALEGRRLFGLIGCKSRSGGLVLATVLNSNNNYLL